MDYVIRLAHPDKGEAAFKKGACFNVQFTKVRNKEPQNRDFTCELLETPSGILDFAVNTSLTEVPHEFIVLRVLAECEVKPSIRLLSDRIGYATGKISKLINILRKEGALVETVTYLTNEASVCCTSGFHKHTPNPTAIKNSSQKYPFNVHHKQQSEQKVYFICKSIA